PAGRTSADEGAESAANSMQVARVDMAGAPLLELRARRGGTPVARFEGHDQHDPVPLPEVPGLVLQRIVEDDAASGAPGMRRVTDAQPHVARRHEQRQVAAQEPRALAAMRIE